MASLLSGCLVIGCLVPYIAVHDIDTAGLLSRDRNLVNIRYAVISQELPGGDTPVELRNSYLRCYQTTNGMVEGLVVDSSDP
jgi:hypothetical protein